MDMPAYSFQETNSILPTDFHAIGRLKIPSYPFIDLVLAGRVDFSTYPFIKAYPFIREVRVCFGRLYLRVYCIVVGNLEVFWAFLVLHRRTRIFKNVFDRLLTQHFSDFTSRMPFLIKCVTIYAQYFFSEIVLPYFKKKLF